MVFSTCISCEKKPVPPSVLTNNATEISATSAISGGIITDDGGSAVITQGICWNTSGDPTTGNNKTEEPGASGSFSGNMTGLSPKTTYYVRAYALNKAGISYGESKSFVTLGERPATWSQNPSNVQTTAATLNGTVNPNSLETTVTFEYGLTTAYGSSVSALQNPVSGASDKNVSAELAQLLPGTTYHFRVKAENSLGTTFSNDLSFTTPGRKPTVTSADATNIDLTSATLNGMVNPNSLETSVTFEYGLSTGYGSSKTARQSPLSGESYQNVSADLTGLNPGTTYHFRIKTENFLGGVYSGDMTFTTLGLVPSAVTKGAQNVTLNSAILNGTLNPNYLATAVTFEWGTTASYGNSVSPVPATVNGHDAVDLAVSITGLNPGTTYHYRIKASNLLGTTESADIVFSTGITDIDGNEYRTVTIGSQMWMAENLRASKYNDGTPIPLTDDFDLWKSCVKEEYCFYNNDQGNKNQCGALYNWFVVDQSLNANKNVCPAGWHIAKKGQWNTLLNYLSQNGYGFGGNSQAIAKSLASVSGWENCFSDGQVGYNPSLNNSSGFNGFPAGLRSYSGDFSVYGRWAGWWAQPDDYSLGYSPWFIVITYEKDNVTSIGLGTNYGSSVRCIKD